MNNPAIVSRYASRRIGLSVLALITVLVSARGEVQRQAPELLPQSSRVHAFYYPWYGNPATDGDWYHWNHVIVSRDGENRHHEPPEDIGANFYPAMGLYSSNAEADVNTHMEHLRKAGVGVVAVSWWGQDRYEDRATPLILKAAEAHGIKVAFHIEPFPGRNARSFRDAVVYLIDSYGNSPAFYRSAGHGNKPLFYVYDSYLTPAAEWATVLDPAAPNTLRGTPHDALIIGLWVKEGDGAFMDEGHFDGYYTYFATEGFTYGSTPANWPALKAFADEHDMLFIPSVGPGYDDTRIGPWNGRNQRDRRNGAYYDEMWAAALELMPDILSITSYDEWHEGTQIAPATPKRIEGNDYLDYGPRAPEYYLDRTRHWVEKMPEVEKRG